MIYSIYNYIKKHLLLFISIFTCFLVYLFPINGVQLKFGIDLSKYIFLAGIIIAYILFCRKDIKKIVCIMLFILTICFFQKSIYALNLLTLFLIPEFFLNNKIQKKYIPKWLLVVCGLGIILYSLIYFGHMGRYVHTGVMEVNQSGFAVLLFAIILRKKSVWLSNVVLFLGLFTFSRNYILCSAVFLFLDLIKSKFKLPVIKFQYVVGGSIIGLILLSVLFTYKYEKNEISEYKTGFASVLNLFDYSNFFRFTVNTNLLEIYYNNPDKILTGLSDEEFHKLNYALVRSKNQRYRKIKCHNFFFSYLKIYGVFAIFIFIYLGICINKILTRNNMHIFLVIILYLTFLGIGLSSYWLYMSFIALRLYSVDPKNRRNKVMNKNIVKTEPIEIKDVTILIKTFERYDALKKLLISIEKYYKNIPIIIVDDSKKNYKDKIMHQFKNMNIKYIVTKYDIGLSKGRNILLKRVKTNYFLLCDDDFEFDDRTQIHTALDLLKSNNLDILGGTVYNRISLTTVYSFLWCLKKPSRLIDAIKKKEFISIYNGKFDIKRTKIELNIVKNVHEYEENKVYDVDICSNFFVAKTDSIKKIGGWKNEILKVGEHELFFLNAKRKNIKVGYTPVFGVVHYPEKKIGYLKFRMRANLLFKKACYDEKIPSFVIKDEKNNIIYSYTLGEKID